MSAPTLQEYFARPPHPTRRQGGWRLRRPGSHERDARGTTGVPPVPPARPLVSVITVVYNGQATLERAIGSVLQQTYPHIEYIVIDGGSTDGTLETIQRYDDRIALWLSEPDSGIFDAMNKGLALATGSYMAILNCDDYYPPRAVESVVARISNQSFTAEDAECAEGTFSNCDSNIGPEAIEDRKSKIPVRPCTATASSSLKTSAWQAGWPPRPT